MRKLTFHIVNVFAESAFSGNPLCVFEDGTSLSDDEMQALALQFNLSETTFLLPSTQAMRRMRIFTPLFEMPFAGHPTLGSAHVARVALSAGDRVTLETKAGIVSITADGDRWQLRVPQAPVVRVFEGHHDALAHALNVSAQDIVEPPRYVNTGSDQFIVRLRSRDAVMRCAPTASALQALVKTAGGRYLAYVFADDGAGKVVSRFFFPGAGGMLEDPGTGSACANLGGYLLDSGVTPPFALAIDQGERTGRRCALSLTVDRERNIFVGGRCVRIGGGVIELA